MKKTFSNLNPEISDYVHELLQPEDNHLKSIREVAQQLGVPDIHVSPMDGRHLTFLTLITQARSIVEIGTLVGYSGICLMRGMPSLKGHLYTFELNSKHAALAKEHFEKAGFESSRYSIHLGSALQLLPEIEHQGPFDLVFIDADKKNYIHYLEWAERNLRKGGILVADNTFAWGEINQKETQDPLVAALQNFNDALAHHPQFFTTMLPTGEGLSIAVKK